MWSCLVGLHSQFGFFRSVSCVYLWHLLYVPHFCTRTTSWIFVGAFCGRTDELHYARVSQKMIRIVWKPFFGNCFPQHLIRKLKIFLFDKGTDTYIKFFTYKYYISLCSVSFLGKIIKCHVFVMPYIRIWANLPV